MSTSVRSKDERLRMQHARIENEREYTRQKRVLESALDDKFSNLSRQELLIKKQQERLENEKQYNKSHSHLTRDRRLSLPAKEFSESNSKTSQSSVREVKSKLFDYEKSSPRSRRQLMESGRTPSVSPSPNLLAMHAIEANKASHSEIVNHLTMSALKKGADRGGHDAKQPEQATTPSIMITDLEQRASRRSFHQPEHKVTFDEDILDSRVNSRENQSACTPQPRSPRRHSEPVPIIHVIDTRRDDVTEDENDAVKLQDLFNKAIETVKQVDESLLTDETNQKTRNMKDRRLSDHKNKTGFDVNALKELEHILNDARSYSSRKSPKDDHSRLDLGSNRAQKKRIEHLEQVLKRLNPKYGDSSNEMDPFQMLQCSYLRLSKSNIATLEEMIRLDGRDPGIHVHSDVTNYNIWTNIENERKDLCKDADEPKKTHTKKFVKTS